MIRNGLIPEILPGIDVLFGFEEGTLDSTPFPSKILLFNEVFSIFIAAIGSTFFAGTNFPLMAPSALSIGSCVA